MHYAARAVWAQFELLLLQQGVLYIKSAAHTTQAKLRMIVPKQKIRRAKVIQPSSDGPSEEQKRQFSLTIDQYESISAINNCDLG